MYSVILVDDELSLRESIKNLVDWQGNGFKLIGTAENGLDALELMNKQGIPDVVITDIKMPVMNGIEFAKKLREEHPTVRLVFLSGYDEFQYAAEGIRLNVVSYLLKPISRNELEECLKNLKIQIDEEIRAANDFNLVSAAYNKNIELMKVSFLNALLTEKSFEGSKSEFDDFLVTHELEFLKNNKMLFTIRFANKNKTSSSSSNQINREFQRFSLYQIIQEIAKKYSKSEVFIFSSYVICIVTGNSKELEEIRDILPIDIIDTAKKLLNEQVVIGISEPYNDLFQTRKAYRETITALDYMNTEENENILFIGDIERIFSKSDFLYELDEGSLLLALKTNDLSYVEEMITKSFEEISNATNYRLSILRMLVSIIYVNNIRALRETVGEMDSQFDQWYQRIIETLEYEELSVVQYELLTFCRETMEQILNNRINIKNSLVIESLEYLKENYHDSNVTLKSTSQYLNVSASYFSTIFKKETGRSFIDTLTEMKLNKAKELVLTTDYKMFEIALECGYDDQHYFSYSFKKYFGVSPTKMRRQVAEQVK